MANELAVVEQAAVGMSLPTLADHLVKSGFFKECRDVSKAITKIMLGRSMGIDPTNSMMGIFINGQGKLTLSANLMAMRIKTCGKYRYRFVEKTAKACEIEVFERVDDRWESVGTERVTIDDFKHLTTDVWKKYPKNMLFARCISNVAKFFCPDAFGGAPVYLPDEIPNSGLVVDGETLEVVQDDNTIDVEFKTVDGDVEKKATREYGELVADLGLTVTQLASRLGIDEKVVRDPSEDEAEKLIPKLQVLKGLKT